MSARRFLPVADPARRGAVSCAPLLLVAALGACSTMQPAAHSEPAEVSSEPEQRAPEQPATQAVPAQEAPLAPGTASGEQGAEATPVDETAPALEPPLAGPGEPAVPDEDLSASEEALETSRRSLRSTAEWLARGVDSWFGDKPFEQGGKVTQGKLSIGFSKRQGETLSSKLRLSASLRLPNLQDRAYLYFGRDNDREVVQDTPAAFSRQDRLLADTAEDRTYFAGLGVALRKALELRLGFHGIKPYAQARAAKPWALSERDLLELRQTFFLRFDDRLGSTTALSYERAVSSTLALRWLSATTITQKTNRFDWSSVLGAYKVFYGQRLLSMEGIVSGSQHTGVTFTEYGLQTRFQRPVYKDWLVAEVALGHFWPRSDPTSERKSVWAGGATLTLQF